MNGKTLGPFSLGQLQSFRDKGKLRPEHELSTDRQSWFAASRVAELFAKPEAPATYNFTTESASSDAKEEEWYVEIDGERRGPYPRSRLITLIAAGKVEADDLVWKSGMADWQPAEDFAELFEEPTDGASGDHPARRKRKGRGSQGVSDLLLGAIRRALPESTLEGICKNMLLFGAIGMLVGAFSSSAFAMIYAVRLNNLGLAIGAAGLLLVLIVLQQVGQKMGRAGHDLVQASVYRQSSTAFADSAALLSLLLGLACAVGPGLAVMMNSNTSIEGFTIGGILSFLFGLQFFPPFAFASCCALHPKWLGIDCTDSATAGEEGIAVKAFRLKLMLRMAPIFYGVSGLFGAVGMLIAIVAAFTANTAVSIFLAYYSGVTLLIAGVVPWVAFHVATYFSVGLDVRQSILVIPRKLDRLIEKPH